MTVVKSKPFWKSTTLWINGAGLLAIVLELVLKSNLIPDADVIAIVVAVLNIINRFLPQLRNENIQVKSLTIK